jgi:hypothetical protein
MNRLGIEKNTLLNKARQAKDRDEEGPIWTQIYQVQKEIDRLLGDHRIRGGKMVE